ncbi:hypothetical protein WICPIJ_007027 [Wickerhamomyces pijperi]|uniref:Uncharacterized protein n=1 Tax=Wickerhamomyces pijperi TaxID=599730 RepID=A0A9P8TJM4_WICPI|nr:hypothetical protein WICPIJ_007027 [Wickerhamomyces pijperi]
MMLYPFIWISLNNFATPGCVQSRPNIVRTWPRASDLVIVPSMSEITIGTFCFQRFLINSSESCVFWSVLLYPFMSKKRSPLLSIFVGMLILVSFLLRFWNLSNVASFGDVASETLDLEAAEAEEGGGECDWLRDNSGCGLSTAPLEMSKNSGSCKDLPSYLVGELGGDEPGELEAERTGDVIKSWGTWTFLEVSKTKKASPPSPNFIGKLVNLPLMMKSTFFCDGLSS